MDFKNLISRIFTSLFLILSLFIFIYYFEQYIPLAILFIYIIIFCEILFFFKKKKQRSFFLFFYVLISLISIEIYLIYSYEKILFLYFILLIICFDIFSYVFGTLFGKQKIVPKISPNKTIFGFFAGIFFTLIISFVFNNYFHIFTLMTSFIITLIIISSAFIGDLVESYYKRYFNLKNSSNFLPGHGGIFDRLDSFVMSSISLLIISYFI